VPAERCSTLVNVSEGFRALVVDGYSRRIATLMSRIEEIVCTRINMRLAERLLTLRGLNCQVAQRSRRPLRISVRPTKLWAGHSRALSARVGSNCHAVALKSSMPPRFAPFATLSVTKSL
jgi:hypothetical protein